MELTLIRHTSVAVEPGICYGFTDIEVADSFSTEAEKVKQQIAALPFEQVFCSPLKRCIKLAAYCGFPSPVTDCRLKEMNFGKWEMQKWDEIQDPLLSKWYEDWLHLSATEGESFLDLHRRVTDFLNEIRQKNWQKVCIFTHGGVIACAKVYAGLSSLANAFSEPASYGSIHHLSV